MLLSWFLVFLCPFWSLTTPDQYKQLLSGKSCIMILQKCLLLFFTEKNNSIVIWNYMNFTFWLNYPFNNVEACRWESVQMKSDNRSLGGAYCWRCRIFEQSVLPGDSFRNLGVQTAGFWECRVRQSDVEYGHSSELQYKYKIIKWMWTFMWHVTV